MSPSDAGQLLELISTSLATVEKSCETRGLDIPNLDELYHPSSEAFRYGDPVAAEAADIIGAAALQLAAIFLPPQVTLYQAVGGLFKSAAIRVCLESNVSEILREAGPEGMHVDDIGAKNGQDPQKLGRFLRSLANNHIYREVKPNVFSNTRISSLLDTLKPSEQLLANPEQKHDDTLGFAAFTSHHLDETFKAAAYAWETLSDPTTSRSSEPTATPLSRAMGDKGTMWEIFARPENAFRARRFNIGMRGVRALQPIDASLDAFDWKSLSDGAVVIDVGGGLGTSALPITRDFPGLRVFVQDQPSVVTEAKQLWARSMPEALESGRLVFEVQDFFKPQVTSRNISVFLLKAVLHNWSDEYSVRILTNLRAAARPDTKLVLMETIIPFTCHDPLEKERNIPGASSRQAPAPLLANFGAVADLGYQADIAASPVV